MATPALQPSRDVDRALVRAMTLRALGSLKVNVASLALAVALAFAVPYGVMVGYAVLGRVAALLVIYTFGIQLRYALDRGDPIEGPLRKWERAAAVAGLSWSLLLWAVPPERVGSLGAQALFSIVLLGVASAIITIIGQRRSTLYFSVPFVLSASAYFISLAPSAGYLPLLIALSGIVIIFLFALNIDKQQQDLAETFAENAMLAQSLSDANRELSQALAIADRLARFDQLTGLRNRRSFDEEAQRVDRLRGDDSVFVAMLDVDRFKQLNDRFGHEAGDRVLRAVGSAVDRFAQERGDMLAARIGGEEFALVLYGDRGAREAATCAEAVRARISQAASFEKEGERVAVTASLGATRWERDEPLEQAMQRADRLLYDAKNAGRDRSCDDLETRKSNHAA